MTRGSGVNKLQDFANVFDGIKPWAGKVPKGYLVDFLGVLTDAKFREMFGVNPATTGGTDVETRLPTIEDGEGWFEAANWILPRVRRAIVSSWLLSAPVTARRLSAVAARCSF